MTEPERQPAPPRRYQSGLTDSTRWDQIELRPDDIIISTPSKCGTTWMQMICALLVLGRPELPMPLTALSPWVDMILRPIEDVRADLDGQQHRRFLKTHTPLDGLPYLAGVTYVVVGRDPRDVAVSMHHHHANLDHGRIQQIIGGGGARAGTAPADPADPPTTQEGVRTWLDADDPPEQRLSSLRGTIWHLGDAWARRDDPSVVLVHYGDLRADLEGQMRALAVRLGIPVDEHALPALVQAATFEHMRERSADLLPDERLGVFRDAGRFFRSGTSGEWHGVLDAADLARYDQRLAELAEPDLVTWLHQGSS